MNSFTKSRFLQLHMKLMEDVRIQQEDSLHMLYLEKNKSGKERDSNLILKLKKHINESAVLSS